MNFDTKDDDTPGRYGYGTTAAINTCFKRLSSHKIETTGLLAVNIATLVRNTVDTKLKVHEIVDKVCSYMTNIATDFTAIVANWTTTHHYVVFYYCDAFAPIPEIFRRKSGGATGLLFKEALAGVLDRVKNSKVQSQGNVTSMICIGKEVRQPSYKGLVEIFNRLTKSSVTVHMISHCPVDYHIGRLGRLGILYRSYTGVAIEMTPNKLGELVFDEKGVPFYPNTHVLLGDKSMIKGLLIKQNRKDFVELALKERFSLRSESYIKANSKTTLEVIPYRLD